MSIDSSGGCSTFRTAWQGWRALVSTLLVYAAQGPWPVTRALWRFVSAPLMHVCRMLPAEGAVVDVGCGQGHFLRFCHEMGHRRLAGMEPSGRSLSRARACLPSSVDLVLARAEELPLRDVSCIVVLDVLYLLEPDRQEMFIAAVAAALRPGGVLLIKTMEPSRTIRQMVNRFQEWLAVKVLHITLGRDFSFRSASEWVALCERRGLQAYSIPMWRGYLHPHVLIVARAEGRSADRPHGSCPSMCGW